MTDYSELVKALRWCSVDEYVPCKGCPMDEETHGTGCFNIMHQRAAAAIEELQAEVEKYHDAFGRLSKTDVELEQRVVELRELPKRGEWNDHEVACLLAEMFGDDCACNLNGIDEWLPQYCEFAETCCPNPGGVSCWEQFLKHRAKMGVQDGQD